MRMIMVAYHNFANESENYWKFYPVAFAKLSKEICYIGPVD